MHGIHSHPKWKLGRRPAEQRPALTFRNYLTGNIPAHPVTADHFQTVKFGLYENNKFGDCGPTSVANLVRLVSKGLTGKTHSPTQADVFDLYRRSGNPGFDPATGADDNGVVMQTMLDALLAGGIGDVKPVAFGKISAHDDAAIEAAVAIFGGVLFGVDLQMSQQTQTDAVQPLWDYHAPHAMWGGHAVMSGKYEVTGLANPDVDVISWRMRIGTTPLFRRFQLQEVWAVIFPWHLQNKEFLQGVDVTALRTDFEALTGKPMGV